MMITSVLADIYFLYGSKFLEVSNPTNGGHVSFLSKQCLGVPSGGIYKWWIYPVYDPFRWHLRSAVFRGRAAAAFASRWQIMVWPSHDGKMMVKRTKLVVQYVIDNLDNH